MNDCRTENNSLRRKPKCSSIQVEKSSNKINSSIELLSIDENNLNTEDKLNLPTKNQRLKEYLITNSSDKNLLSGQPAELNINLIDIVPKNDDYKKPVKVKSRWTRTSQMELALENYSSLQTKKNNPSINNLRQSPDTINTVLAIAVTPDKKLNKRNKAANSVRKSVVVNNCHINSENIVAMKKKRGRPKKIVIENKDETPIVFNNDNEDQKVIMVKSNSSTDIKPVGINTPTVSKRGRGRPKKSDAKPDIVLTPKIVSNTATPITRGRKKLDITKVNKNHKKKISQASSNTKTSKINLKVNSDFSNNENSVEKTLANSYSTTSSDSEIDENLFSDNLSIQLVRFDRPLSSNQEQDKCLNRTRTETTKSLCNNEQYVFDFNKVNWNIIPKNTGSKSVQEELTKTKIRRRRNSVSKNFTFTPLNSFKIQNDDFNLMKSWKSLSYLEGGPNIQIERYQQKELDKKYRSRLKRSRSFPECIQLDTVVWRYLCYQQTYEINDCFEEISDYEMNLINELPEYGHNLHYRSKSVPLEKCDYNEMGKTTYKCKSLTDLNVLNFTNDFKTSFQISSSSCDIINSESVREEHEGKIRRSKRLNTKVKTNDFLEEDFLLEFSKSSCDYLQVAEEIRRENEKQLEEAKKNDPELEKKLNKLNFTLVTDNIFRPNRKNMSEYTPAEAIELRKLKLRRPIIGDTYSCNCKYSKQDWSEGKPGCGPECINRLLNIECGSGCLLMSACSNKQFQNKQFKRTQIVRTANKGYGVFALEDIPSGTFVDEYMGEVIDQHEMIKRMKKKLYMNNNYMVQLNHDEIIDATRKGNITRFINHSCEPNCVAEKWNVLGESRMGFFSKQQIHKGEEITFDYSFEIFGDTAQQKCYCGTAKCRGFISKKSKTGYLSSSSDESDDAEETSVIRPDEQEKKKKKITKIVKKITYKDKKRLQELDQQLTNISRIKNKNRSDLENSTLNLNKLMVHITDSMSRSHILKFIRENDLNCKKLFMNFNGLSIIHSWMISSNNESLKLEIIKTLSDLPISNRNTITKSKVIDIVAEWANIPSNIKETIEDLKYPETKSTEHGQEVEKLLPNEKNISQLAQEARVLWKKWIILRMLFKIPKLDRPKEVEIPNIICKPPIILPPTKRKLDQYHFGKPMIPSQPSKINFEHFKNKFKHVKYEPSKGTPENPKNKTNSIETFSKMINHHNQKNNLNKYKAVLEWNKKQIQHTEYTLKANNINKVYSYAKIQDSSPLVLNSNRVPTFQFELQEITTIETTPTIPTISKNMKRNNFKPAVYEVPTDDSVQSVPANKIIDETDYYPIETVHCELPPPTFREIHDKSILNAMFQVAPPNFSEKWSNLFKVTDDVTFSKSSSTTAPDGMLYDELHPSVEEQYAFMSSQSSSQNPNNTLIDTTYTEPTITETNNSIIEIVEKPLSEEVRIKLLKQCEDNLKKLKDKGILDVLKSAKNNYIDQSPMKIPASFFKKKLSFFNEKQQQDQLNLFKYLKIVSNNYREQPSRLIKLKQLEAKSALPQNKNDIFRIKEKQTVKCDTTSLALKLFNEQLSAVPQSINIKKLLSKKSVKIKTENKFACKILNGYMKKFSAMPVQFVIKQPRDTKISLLDSAKELDLYHKLTPTVNNKLCAKLKDNTVSVFKQQINMKYDETKPIRLESLTKESLVFLKDIDESINIPKKLKRKLPLPPMENVKSKKISDSSMENIDLNELGGEDNVTITNQLKDSEIFKKPLPLIHHKNHRNKYFNIETITDCQVRDPRISSPIAPSIAQQNKKVNEFRQKPSTSSAEIKMDENEIRQKPLMKCLPFNKVDNISATDLEKNLKILATNLSMSYSADLSSSTPPKNELIEPIVKSFKNSIILNNSKGRYKDDPIVQDYIRRTSLPAELKVRKYKLPESMTSLPVEILNLVPDNPKDIKNVVDFYHSMATVIVKVLDSYVKKSCKQGRIKNDEDFKYLAKKLNSNILYKELQVKKVEDLRISESVKQKVGQYIKTYMYKYGKLYRRKSTDT